MSQSRVLVGQIALVFMIIILSIWSATQWTAEQLGHQPRLGLAWFTLADTPVYKPWRLFQWWYAYEPYAPEVFNKAGLMAGGGGILGALVAVCMSVWRSRLQKNVTTYGSAKWAERRDIKRAGLLDDDGVFLGKWDCDYLRHSGPEHIMAFAPTRSGIMDGQRRYPRHQRRKLDTDSGLAVPVFSLPLVRSNQQSIGLLQSVA